MIRKRLSDKPPIFLEVKGSRAALATTEIKYAGTAPTCSTHDLPIHEIIGRQVSGARGATTIVRKNFVSEMEAHNRADRPLPVRHDQELTVISKLALQFVEVVT